MNAELSIAKDAAIEAGGLILSYYKADYEIKDKGYHNPVTTADHAADARLKEILTGNYPNYGWLSEETVDSKERLERDRVWVVDPLDGQKINCSEKQNINEMVILNSRSETKKGLWEPFDSTFKELKAIGSVAYKLGLTAAGRADIFASLRPKNEWDICAGNCIINEAGGKLVDLYGNAREYNSSNTLITPGLIAGQVTAVDKTFSVLGK